MVYHILIIKKSIINILKHLDGDLNLTLALWFADDGMVSACTRNGTYRYPRLSIATCSEADETMKFIVSWFKINFNVNPWFNKIKTNGFKKSSYNCLRFSVAESKILFNSFFKYISHLSSMQYKFRYFTQEYNIPKSVLPLDNRVKMYAELYGDIKK